MTIIRVKLGERNLKIMTLLNIEYTANDAEQLVECLGSFLETSLGFIIHTKPLF